jgi:hypothetical protein
LSGAELIQFQERDPDKVMVRLAATYRFTFSRLLRFGDSGCVCFTRQNLSAIMLYLRLLTAGDWT